MANIPMGQVKPNNWNPNEMTEAEFAELVTEIQHLGKPAKPIVLRRNGQDYEIVDGEHTYRALLQLEIPALQPGWYEIEDYDDFEAMRQTYKRNQHGKHNPVKQGQLFKRMMDAGTLSRRALAEEIGVSEGTIRNSLLYEDASERRPDFDFSKLSLRQVRYFLGLPPMLGGLWIDCGADIKAAWGVKTEAQFEKLHTWESKDNPPDLQDLEKTGLVTFLKPSRDFAACLKKMHEWDNFETRWEWAGFSRDVLRPYTLHYYRGAPGLAQGYQMKEALNTLIDWRSKPYQFRLTPEEFAQVVIASEKEERNLKDYLKLTILEKCGADALQYVDWSMQDRLQDMELDAAPDWIKSSKLDREYKFMLWRQFTGDHGYSEAVKREVAGLRRITREGKEGAYEAMRQALKRAEQFVKYRDQWYSRNESDIARTLAERLCRYTGKPDRVGILQATLLAFTKEELLALDHSSARIEEWEAVMRGFREGFA